MKSHLNYPKKSHRKIIHIPSESKLLAELMGAEFGDGGINNPWQLVISLNANLDKDYSEYLSANLERLFKIKVHTRIRPKNTLVLVCSSMNLVDFLTEKGAVRGNKVVQQIDTPAWILKTSEYKKAFVRGLVDTDGCIYTHKHYVKGKFYYNIGLCFSNYSKKLILSITQILKDFDLKPRITNNGTRIYLYGEKAVVHYLSIFGSSNTRIRNQYLGWRDVRVA
jgi:DNA-binding transcriptional regulator WhiA